MSQVRQQLLVLCLADPDLESHTVAWSLYDGAKAETDLQMQTGDSMTPPYASVLAAMRDGWRVIQFPQLPHYSRGAEHDLGHLPFEYVLERFVDIGGGQA